MVNDLQVKTHLSLTDFGNWTIGRNMPESYGNWGLTLTRSETTEEGDTLIPNSDPYQIIGSGYQQIDAAQDFLFQISPRASLLVQPVFDLYFYCSNG